jgi:hypothetical protein
MNALLLDRLTAWEKRLRRQAAVRAAVLGSFGGAAIAAGYVGGAKLWHWPQPMWVAAGAFVAVPVLAFGMRLLRKIPLADVARAADRASGSDDRFSTALELEGTEWAALVERDAASRPLPDERRMFATRWPKFSRWSFVTAAVIAALIFFVPERSIPVIAGLPNDLTGLEAPPEMLAAADELRQAGAEEGDPKLAELGKELERISEAWKEGKIDRKEALARIGEVSEKIREEKEKAAARREALAMMAESSASHDLGHRTSQGNGSQAASDAASKLGQNPADDMKLAEALERAAKAAGKDKELAEALRKAAEAARRGDKKAFEEAMQKARERWNGLSKNGAEQAARDAADRKKNAGKMDEKLLKELERLLKAKGLDDKDVQEALERLAQLSKKLGQGGEQGAMDDEKLKELIEKVKEMDAEELKKLAEMMKKMSEEDLKKLAEELEKSCPGGS